ncbi:MAG: bifunctional precorrin-2 dehydrogenase/sirohydrochlorin ferrochelatase [Magnetococcales bacterium]|nr:bifunctional precorrin-2 dehydrogenase/sirohydrochlorin ferrochelatase [Magnetococcales bacterium]MBF0155597.1 bifunctional precorrin-2 dehydrogenase/sirohydrochlorin ferrochelatase [Magnetococcales bacterium]
MEARPPLFPLFLDLRDKSCLVVGGAGEAPQKVAALLMAGARVTIVARELDDGLFSLVREEKVEWRREDWSPDHLQGVWLVVSASTDPELNRRLDEETRRRRLPLNVVDAPQYGWAVWPALVDRDPVRVAISSGGSSPALAAYLRRRVEATIPEGIGGLARWLAAKRPGVAGQLAGLKERGRFWRRLFDEGLAERYLAGGGEGAEKALDEAVYRLREGRE